jgi:hypothetical protein
MNAIISEQIQNVGQLLFDSVPEGFAEAWLYSEVTEDTQVCDIFNRGNSGGVVYAKSSPELRDAAFKLWELYREADPEPWTTSTMWVNADGKMNMQYTYEPVRGSQWDRRHQWLERYVGTTEVTYPPL